VISEFFAICGCDAHLESEFSLKYTADRPRQPAYEIKLMLSHVSWALTHISRSSLQSYKAALLKPICQKLLLYFNRLFLVAVRPT